MLGWCGTEGGASTVCNWRRASLTDSPQSCTAVITEQLVSSGLQQGFGAPSVAFPKSSCSRTFSFRSNIDVIYSYHSSFHLYCRHNTG